MTEWKLKWSSKSSERGWGKAILVDEVTSCQVWSKPLYKDGWYRK